VSHGLCISNNIGPEVLLGRLVIQTSRHCSVLMFSQKAQYNQKVQECESLHTEPPGSFVTTPPASSTSQSSAFPPSSPVESPTSFTSKIASRLGFTRSPSVNSPRMSTLGNAGIGAGGGPPSPAGSSVASDIAYPFLFRAKALNACACQNSLAFAFDLTMYYRYRVPR
jgi:hypothetical protein